MNADQRARSTSAALFTHTLDSAAHLADVSRRPGNGNNRAADARTCAELAARGGGLWLSFWRELLWPGPAHDDPFVWEEDCVADHKATVDRPLTTSGFRRVADGTTIRFRAERVRIEPAILPAGEDQFHVKVDLTGLPHGVYEGFVTTTTDPSTAITDTLLPAW